MSKRGLGRGLDALFSGGEAAKEMEQDAVGEIGVEEISPNPFQPRQVFDDEALAELTQSIRQYGVVQPIVVRKVLDGYQLVSGERRWRAARAAGLKKIPAVVREYNDAEMTEIALIENLQRENLNPIEEAGAFRKLMKEFGLTQDEVSYRVGKSRSHVANTMRLLNLNPNVQEYVSRGTLTMGQVKPLIGIENWGLQLELSRKIIEEDLSARAVEEMTKRLSKKKTDKKLVKENPNEYYIGEVEDKLKMFLGTQVRIRNSKGKGRIEIDYASLDELERIVETLSEQLDQTVPKVASFVV